MTTSDLLTPQIRWVCRNAYGDLRGGKMIRRLLAFGLAAGAMGLAIAASSRPGAANLAAWDQDYGFRGLSFGEDASRVPGFTEDW